MTSPSMESLTKMALLETTGENTEILSLREEEKRQEYYDKFHIERNKHHKNVAWGIDAKASGSLRCNANIVLMQIAAKIPASPPDNRPGLPLRFPIFPNSEKGKIYFNEFPKLGIKVSMDFLFFLKIGRALFN